MNPHVFNAVCIASGALFIWAIVLVPGYLRHRKFLNKLADQLKIERNKRKLVKEAKSIIKEKPIKKVV